MRVFVILCLVATLFFSHGGYADVFQGAEWIRDPVFAEAPVLNLLHREVEPVPALFGPTNVHTLFRKEIVLKAAPAAAVLSITADDYVKLYVNDQFVVQGPAPAYHFAYPYLWLDIKDFMQEGDNCLAAHVYYQGLRNRVWNSADNRSGLMAALEVTYEDGSMDRFVTDSGWRCHTLEAFPAEETIGYKTQFLEHVDMRKMPRGWTAAGFNDSAWDEPLRGMQDHAFIRQMTPPLQLYRRNPETTKKIGKGHYQYDFGQVLVGHTRIRIKGPAGHSITVRHGEELTSKGEVRYEMRANCRYDEQPILSGEEDVIAFYDYRCFRYMEILDAPEEPEVWVEVRHHPFNEEAVSFTSDMKLLQDTWNICMRGVQMGSQEIFVDCPSREKGQYLGDAVITARSHLWLTADPTLTRKALMDFAHSQQIDVGMMAVAPGSFMQEIAEYSLQYPLLALNYYRMTGDRVLARYVVDNVYEGLFQYFTQFENESGLLVGLSKEANKWVVLDWPANLRDDYDYDYSLTAGNTVLNAFYYGGLRAAAELQRLLGMSGVRYDTRADKLALAFSEHLADPAAGLYLDAPGSKHSSLHANAVPLAFGLTEGADRARMLEFIRAKELACGVYIASYVIEGCFKAGDGDLGFSLLTSTGEHSWNEMLKHGATTCMEAWGPDQKKNCSWCHPWSSCPIYMITEYVLGLGPAEPGWKRIRISPSAIANLPDMDLTVPTPVGEIQARYSAKEGYYYMTPANIPIELVVPEGLSVKVETRTGETAPVAAAPAEEELSLAGWPDRVGAGLGLWASVRDQALYAIKEGRVIWSALCSTAAKGVGSIANSEQTPPGWHRVAQKFGDNEPWGRVFRSRMATSQVWRPEVVSDEDLVLTRVLWLEGMEPGVNRGKDAQGRNVDSFQRYIYIHGTNGEARLGQPASHGCIRLSNDAALTLYELVPEGTLLYIAV